MLSLCTFVVFDNDDTEKSFFSNRVVLLQFLMYICSRWTAPSSFISTFSEERKNVGSLTIAS